MVIDIVLGLGLVLGVSLGLGLGLGLGWGLRPMVLATAYKESLFVFTNLHDRTWPDPNMIVKQKRLFGISIFFSSK